MYRQLAPAPAQPRAPRDAPGPIAPGLAAILPEVLDQTEEHLEGEGLRGWDPYDALCSPLFSLPVLRSNRMLRFGAQQVVKRSPWNLRPLLRIPRQLNPVSIGLYLQGIALRAAGDPATLETGRAKAQGAIDRLAAAASSGYSGSCWGYPFDWEARHGSIPRATPTVVATGMVANGLWTAHEALGLQPAAELLVSAAEFVARDLPRLQAGEGTFCWAYSPTSRQSVLNATLKGSRLLAQAHRLGGSSELLDAASESVRFALAHQLPSGAWPYSLAVPRADNFHTGYVLECLSAYRTHSGDTSVDGALARGWAYYRERFFTDELLPKYYDDRVDPLDATACAQSIITLCEFGDLDGAARVAERAIGILGMPDGSFAYQRRGGRIVSTPFLRWSTAWMYCGLSRLAAATAPTSVLN